MAQGSVKWFNAEKGYGFIEIDGGRADVFVHHSKIDMDGYRTLDEGQRESSSRRSGQSCTLPPGTHREPIARSAPRRTASIRPGSCSGRWEASASISTSTS